MKIIKTASGKRVMKISKREWVSIGKTAGWLDDLKSKLPPGTILPEGAEELFKSVDDIAPQSKPQEGKFDHLWGNLNLKDGSFEYSVGWNKLDGGYEVYFPDADINSQIIRISDDPSEAKKVFDTIKLKFENARNLTLNKVCFESENIVNDIMNY